MNDYLALIFTLLQVLRQFWVNILISVNLMHIRSDEKSAFFLFSIIKKPKYSPSLEDMNYYILRLSALNIQAWLAYLQVVLLALFCPDISEISSIANWDKYA